MHAEALMVLEARRRHAAGDITKELVGQFSKEFGLNPASRGLLSDGF